MSTRISPAMTLLLSLVLLISASATGAVFGASTPEKEYKALVAEYDKAQSDFSRIISAARTEAEREKALEKYPQPAKYAGRFLTFAEQNSKAPAALDALIWIVSRAGYSPEADTALRRLTEDHVTSEKLGPACQSVIYSQSKQAGTFLRAVLEQNSHKEVQARATISLGRHLKEREPDSQSAIDEAEKLFERVVEKFGDFKGYERTLGEEARSELFEMRHLGIGQVAPEIEGEDADGKKFKLSDYAGRVRVIDFWGDW